MMKTNVKSKLAFDSVTAPLEAKILRLFPEAKPVAPAAPVRESNETIRQRQFAMQSELLRIAQESTPAPVTKDMLAKQNQIVANVSEDKIAQAAKQENNGSIFSSAFTTFCFR